MCFDKYCIPEEMFSYFHSDIVLSKLTLFQVVSLCVCTCVCPAGVLVLICGALTVTLVSGGPGSMTACWRLWV